MKKPVLIIAISMTLVLVQIPIIHAGSCTNIYVDNGIIVGGPMDGQAYEGTLVGTPDCDHITGTDGNDLILGKGARDNLNGGEGDDIIKGGPDRDIIDGGPGNDTILGGPGNDYLSGHEGDDLIKGGDGNDIILGQANFDLMLGGPGNDTLTCDDDRRPVLASNGRFTANQAKGGSGTDSIYASALCKVMRSIEIINN